MRREKVSGGSHASLAGVRTEDELLRGRWPAVQHHLQEELLGYQTSGLDPGEGGPDRERATGTKDAKGWPEAMEGRTCRRAVLILP